MLDTGSQLETKMTLADERYRALKQGMKLLEELLDPGKTPRVPSMVRERARGILRHFPTDYDIDRMADGCPDVLDNRPFSVYNSQTINKGQQ
jgi:hypothetical protein